MIYALYLLALIFALAFVFYVLKTWDITVGKVNTAERALIKSKWQEIEQSLLTENVQNLNSAVVNADKLFDHVLKGLVGKKDANMGERLKLAKNKFGDYETYQGVWEAHKIRNRLVHEIHSEILTLESKRAIDKFKKGLIELGVL